MNDPGRMPSDAIARLRRLAPDAGLWRGLEELADTAEFRAFVEAEFPALAGSFRADRRRFLKLAGASLALAGLAGCTRPPPEKIVPYARSPQEIVPAEALYYATALPFDGYAQGVLVKSVMGRPTKVEGNPRHPASLGGTGIHAQAAVLDLWDPERSRGATHRGEPATWDGFLQALAAQRARWQQSDGRGLHLLTGRVTSPTLTAQIAALLDELPQARWHVHEPAASDNATTGAQIAFGAPRRAVLRLEAARRIVALDADFLGPGPLQPRYARHFAAARRPDADGGPARLYAAEPAPTLTGAAADHRLPLAAGSVDALTRALARRLGIDAPQAGELPPEAERWLDLVAPDLERHHGAALVVAGDTQPPAVHAVVAAINVRLGSAGHTLAYLAPDTDGPAPEPVEALAAAYDAAAVDTLIVAGCNPAYDTPPDLDLARRLAGTPFVAHLGLYRDETAAAAAWHLPAVHAFEDWSDLRAFDGTASIAQPVIAPLYAGRSLHQLVDALRSGTGRSAAALVKAHWQDAFGEDFDARWQPALQAGVVDGSALADATPKLREDWQRGLPVAAPATRLELVIRPDPTVHDGRYAPNAWLQELPKPLTQLTWDNAALVSPQLAEREGLENGALVELAVDGRNVRAPVWIVPGTSPQSIVVTLGYGRRLADGAEAGGGYDAYRLRASHAPWRRDGVTLAATGARQRLVSTQLHHSMEGRELVRHATLNAYRADPHFAQDAHRGAEQPSMYPPWPRGDCAWGMSIDLNACIGCNACIVACQAENNIPVVGKDEVARGREMHWLRVDRYYAGPLDAPRILFQPVPCMHCELAPCEVVCPVAATLHDSQGLNLQVYNRCVGTRFCSNNCPYKVRRFNFFEYAASEPALVAQRNPEVTVRSRGVMEKCTYCIQRIQGARIEAGKAGRELRDGEVVTACQGACPAQAIVFGNLADADSEVARAKRSPLDYALLGELNTRPRTTYRARVTNPASESGSDGA